MTPAAAVGALLEAIKNDGGLVFLFILILITGMRRVWVFGRELERVDRLLTNERVAHMSEMNAMREERDTWRRMSLLQQGQRGPTPPPPNPLEGG